MTPPTPKTSSLRKKFKRARQIIKYTNIISNLGSDDKLHASLTSGKTATTGENEDEDNESAQAEGASIYEGTDVVNSFRRKSTAFRRNKQLAVQNEAEIKLFELAELGDVTGIRNLLLTPDGRRNRNIDINKPNLSGYTILHVAVQRGDENLVQLLLSVRDVDIQDTLFYAIKEQNLAIVKMILFYEVASNNRQLTRESQRSQLSLSFRSLDESPTPDELEEAIVSCTRRKNEMSSEFDEDITPVMLAAQVGSYQLIKFFHDYNNFLPQSEEIHKPACKCVKCKVKGPIGMALTRLHYFMAVSNVYYMIFLANRFQNYDPILTAFNLVKKLEEYKHLEHEFHLEYDELIADLKTFATDLLGLCRTTFEVDTLLGQRNGYEGDKRRYPRLFLAVVREQKEFVTHPHAQEALTKEWLGWWPAWRRYGMIEKIAHTIFRLPVVVFGGFWLVFDDQSRYAKKFTAPVCRFLNSVVSYLVFLTLLICALTLPTNPRDQSVPRSFTFAMIEWLIVFFALGHICSTLKQLSVMPRTFISLPWTWYDIATHIAFIITFAFWLIAWINVPLRYRAKSREYWDPYHPLLIAEGFFAIASILSFGRILRLFYMSARLGPMQIYLGRMVSKGVLPFLLSLLFIFAAATGLSSIYHEYQSWESVDPRDPGAEVKVQSNYLTSIPKAMHSLVWAMLGLPNLEVVEIVPTYTGHGRRIRTIHHTLAVTVGTIIYAMFMIVAVTVMLNTVISMMTGAGSAALEDREMEWKFARSQMYIIIGSDTKVPSPYNIFRLSFSFTKFLGSGQIGKMCGRKKRQVSSPKELAVYAKLVKELVRRYFYAKAEASLKENATTDQVINLREIVSGLKDKYKSLSLGAYKRDRRAKADLNAQQGPTRTPGAGQSARWPARVEQVNEMIGSAVGKIATPAVPAPPPPPSPPRPDRRSKRRGLDGASRGDKPQATVTRNVIPPTPPPMPPTPDRHSKPDLRRQQGPERVPSKESRTRVEQVNERTVTGGKSVSPLAPKPPPPPPPPPSQRPNK